MKLNFDESLLLSVEDENCLDPNSEFSLRKSQLEVILDTVYPNTASPILVSPDRGYTVYSNDNNHLSAYQVMESRTEVTDIKNIWANYSPCTDCVKLLISTYEKHDDKPTVHVGRIYTPGSTFKDAVLTLQCLARLKHDKFDIVPWNFEEFKSYTTAACDGEIDERLGNSSFNSEYMKLESQVQFIHQLSENPHAGTWC